jgi:hypothetical protein
MYSPLGDAFNVKVATTLLVVLVTSCIRRFIFEILPCEAKVRARQ